MKKNRVKRVHILVSMWSEYRKCWDIRPACKVDNKTFEYAKTTSWKETDCRRCLVQKPKYEEEQK